MMMESFYGLILIIWKWLLMLQISILNGVSICFSKNLSIGIIPSYLDEQSPEFYRISLDIAEYLNILLQKFND
jgi:hypothetical protein